MPATLVTIFEQLAEKAGIKTDDANLIAMLQKPELMVTIPDEISSAINKNLIGIDDAKNNHPTIKSHYFAEVMANVDRALAKAYQAVGIDDDLVEELNRETSSTKRIALFATKLKELTDEQVKTASKGKDSNTVELQRQIDDLNNQLRVEKDARKNDKAQHDTSLKTYKIDNILSGKIGGLKTVYDNLPADVRQTTIRTLLDKELQDSEVRLELDENGNLRLLKKDGSNYYDENNQLVKPDDFVQRTLAKNKILSQSAPVGGNQPRGGENGQQHNGQQQQQQHVPAGNGQNKGVDITSLIDESLKALGNENPVSIAAGK